MEPPRALHRYATLVASATFLLLIAGGLVTSTDSGLAVPDWPLSYGTWFPPMVGGIRFEHGHRMIAGCVGLLILGLAVWLSRAESRRWVRRLGFAAVGAVVLQALLGGLTVLLLLPPQVSIAHAALGQSVFCLVVCIAWATAPGWGRREPLVEDSRRPSLRALGVAVPVAAFLQLLLGAVIRHTGHAVTAHIVGAIGLLSLVAWLLIRSAGLRREAPVVWRQTCRFAGVLGMQIMLGGFVFTHRGSVVGRTAHVVCGALVLAQAVILAWDILRRVAAPRARGALADYLELTKPRLSGLVLLTTGVGFWLGLQRREQLWLLWPVCVGTALVVGGANALNQWSEREEDARMHRTRHRPLPAGRLRPDAAFRFGLGISVAGILVLAAAVNMLTAILAAVSWASYVLVYTPLKRRTPLCTLVGAVPGALPTLIGWAAARNTVDLEGLALFLVLFVWQLPHFLALALLYRDDYARAGFPMLPLMESGGRITAGQIALYGLVLVPVSLFPAFVGVAGRWYGYGALCLSLAFLAVAARAAWQRSTQAARQLFHASLLYLPILFGLLALDRAPL